MCKYITSSQCWFIFFGIERAESWFIHEGMSAELQLQRYSRGKGQYAKKKKKNWLRNGREELEVFSIVSTLEARQ